MALGLRRDHRRAVHHQRRVQPVQLEGWNRSAAVERLRGTTSDLLSDEIVLQLLREHDLHDRGDHGDPDGPSALVLAALLFDYIGRRFGNGVATFLRATYYLPR